LLAQTQLYPFHLRAWQIDKRCGPASARSTPMTSPDPRRATPSQRPLAACRPGSPSATSNGAVQLDFDLANRTARAEIAENAFEVLRRYLGCVAVSTRWNLCRRDRASQCPALMPGIALRPLTRYGTRVRSLATRETAMALKGSKTEQSLRDAFAGESQANRRYLYFANKADIEGQNDVAALFRSTAEGETGHAHGHLEFLEHGVGDPATGLPIGTSRQNLMAAVAGETHEYTDMYPGMAKTARQEGFDEVADWFETLAKAERSHANRYQKALDALVD
jgi:rubrerythrin